MTLFLMLASLTLGIAGCGGHDVDAPQSGAKVAVLAENEFDMAIELIENAEEFEAAEARKEAINRLNRWLEDQEPDAGWIADPLIGKLPSHLRDTSLFQGLDSMQFTMTDALYLQQAAWLRDLAQWLVEGELDPLSKKRYEATLAAQGEALAADEAEELRHALLLFDWTVRNVQLDRTASQVTGRSDTGGPSAVNAPVRGVAGPGYTLFPWQVLQFGHGDAWQRACIFLMLCQQSGIEGVVLGFEEPASAPVRLWAAATIIGGELFLFDTGLGLALPGKDGAGLATLSAVAKDPSILRALDYDDGQGAKYDYPVADADLTRVVALVNAPVESLSQRMGLLERKLAGDHKMALTVVPATIVEKLRPIAEVKSTTLWTVPYEMHVYRAAVEQTASAKPAEFEAKFKEEGLFRNMPPLIKGRRLHLRGDFDRRGTASEPGEEGASESLDSAAVEIGAKEHYMNARMTDRELESIFKSKEALTALKLMPNPGEDEAAWQARMEAFAAMMRAARPYANYWLGLSHYENRKYDSSANWFANQVLADDAEAQWHTGARYNQGRAREAMGQTSEAIAAWRADASPQRHGNLLRAKWLEEAVAQSSSP